MGRLGRVLALAVALTGCIEHNLARCGDQLCPLDSVCLASGQCASRDAVEACGDATDGTPCHTNLFDGTCIGGACAAPRCGDGQVAGAEQCDGTVANRDCVEFGYDTGIPACTASCTLDVIEACTRFGWRRLSATRIARLWLDGDRQALVRETDRALELRIGGELVVDTAQTWDGVTGTSEGIYVWWADNIKRFAAGAQTDIAGPADVHLDQVVADDDGTLYASDDSPCQVFSRAPGASSWQSLVTEALPDCDEMLVSSNGLLVGFEDGSVRRWNGSWQLLFSTTRRVLSLVEHDGYIYAGTYEGGLHRWRNGVVSSVTNDNQNIFTLVASGSYVFFDNFGGRFARVDGTHLEDVAAPIAGSLFADRAGHLYAYGNGLYEFSGKQYATHEGVPIATDVVVLADGNVVVTTEQDLLIRENDNDWDVHDIATAPRSLAGRSVLDLYATDGTSLEHFDGTSFTSLQSPFTSEIHALWATPSGEPSLYAVGEAGTIMARSGSNWTTQGPPAGGAGCTLRDVTGNATDIYAVGGCGTTGIVWKRSAGAWSEVYRGGTPLASVAVASDGEVFAAGTDGGARTRSGVWAAEPAAIGVSISATTSSDVFVGGGPGDLVHWNGTEWSRVAVVGASQPRVAATPHAVYIAGAAQSVLLR